MSIGAHSGRRDWWPAALFGAHLIQVLCIAHWHPVQLFDPDLLAYFTYFRNWLASDTSLYGVPYFTHPKPLLVFSLGPLGNVWWAFSCSAIASAFLGSLVYIIGRDAFGRLAGILLSGFLLIDQSKALLTLRSSADLYITLLLFLMIYLCGRGRLGLASVSLFLSALIKPVTLPCALCFVANEDRRKSAWLWALIPFLALPLTLWSNRVLLGSAFASEHFLLDFAAMRDTQPIAFGEVLHFVVWKQLVQNRFMSTAPLGFIGLLLWLAGDRRRLTSPLFLAPLLFVGGYAALSLASPYMPFFRFFLPVEIWFLGFLIFGLLETARQLAGGRGWVKGAVAVLLMFFLTNDFVLRAERYRDTFAVPFEKSMTFVQTAVEVMMQKPASRERILAPLGVLPYLVWELKSRGSSDVILTAEQVALDGTAARAEWVLHVPPSYASDKARDYVARMIAAGGYEVRLTDGVAALLRLAEPPAATSN